MMNRQDSVRAGNIVGSHYIWIGDCAAKCVRPGWNDHYGGASIQIGNVEGLIGSVCEQLESRPRAGTRVRIPTKKDVEEQYVVREALETQAARLFAQKATAEEKADLHKLAVLLDSPNENGVGRLSYLGLHEKLHQKITEYAHCPALSDAVEETYALASAWMCVDRSEDASSGHQSLVEALASGDAATAAKAMSLHIHARKQEALARLKPYFALKKKRGTRYPRGFK